jgi:hypothetical protein
MSTLGEPPTSFDPLWFRIRYLYRPIVVTEPRSILKVTTGL